MTWGCPACNLSSSFVKVYCSKNRIVNKTRLTKVAAGLRGATFWFPGSMEVWVGWNFFFFTPQMNEGFFLVSLVGEVFFFFFLSSKKTISLKDFEVKLDFSAAKSFFFFFFFFTPQGSEGVFFFFPSFFLFCFCFLSLNGGWFFFNKISMPSRGYQMVRP